MHRISQRWVWAFLLWIWSPRMALKAWLPVSALLRRLALAANWEALQALVEEMGTRSASTELGWS